MFLVTPDAVERVPVGPKADLDTAAALAEDARRLVPCGLDRGLLGCRVLDGHVVSQYVVKCMCEEAVRTIVYALSGAL